MQQKNLISVENPRGAAAFDIFAISVSLSPFKTDFHRLVFICIFQNVGKDVVKSPMEHVRVYIHSSRLTTAFNQSTKRTHLMDWFSKLLFSFIIYPLTKLFFNYYPSPFQSHVHRGIIFSEFNLHSLLSLYIRFSISSLLISSVLAITSPSTSYTQSISSGF